MGLTQNRAAIRGSDNEIVRSVEAQTRIYVGSLVAVDTNGYAVPAQPLGAAPLDTLEIVGVMLGVLNGSPGENADNTTYASSFAVTPGTRIGDEGALKIRVGRGVFGFDNDGSLNEANVAAMPLVFAVDDHTVSLSDNGATQPCAGRALFIGENGQVFVDTRDRFATATVAGV